MSDDLNTFTDMARKLKEEGIDVSPGHCEASYYTLERWTGLMSELERVKSSPGPLDFRRVDQIRGELQELYRGLDWQHDIYNPSGINRGGQFPLPAQPAQGARMGKSGCVNADKIVCDYINLVLDNGIDDGAKARKCADLVRRLEEEVRALKGTPAGTLSERNSIDIALSTLGRLRHYISPDWWFGEYVAFGNSHPSIDESDPNQVLSIAAEVVLADPEWRETFGGFLVGQGVAEGQTPFAPAGSATLTPTPAEAQAVAPVPVVDAGASNKRKPRVPPAWLGGQVPKGSDVIRLVNEGWSTVDFALAWHVNRRSNKQRSLIKWGERFIQKAQDEVSESRAKNRRM